MTSASATASRLVVMVMVTASPLMTSATAMVASVGTTVVVVVVASPLMTSASATAMVVSVGITVVVASPLMTSASATAMMTSEGTTAVEVVVSLTMLPIVFFLQHKAKVGVGQRWRDSLA